MEKVDVSDQNRFTWIRDLRRCADNLYAICPGHNHPGGTMHPWVARMIQHRYLIRGLRVP
jgi:hypothetical protein